MYTKEQAQQLRTQFWIQFAEKYPRKWLLYNTQIKDFAFKFNITPTQAEVQLVIENKDLEKRKIYFEKMQSLQNVMKTDYDFEPLFYKNYLLSNGKNISLITLVLSPIKTNNPENWDAVFEFFNTNMSKFEYLFYEYQDYINDLTLNT